MIVKTEWKALAEKLRELQIKREPIAVIYDIGYGKELYVSFIEKVKNDSLKLVGCYWLGFIEIIEIRSDREVIYPKPRKRQK